MGLDDRDDEWFKWMGYERCEPLRPHHGTRSYRCCYVVSIHVDHCVPDIVEDIGVQSVKTILIQPCHVGCTVGAGYAMVAAVWARLE